MFDKLTAKIDSYKQSVIDIQKLLVSIPALAPENDGDGEDLKAKALMEYLKKEGFPEPVNYPAPDSRVSSGERPNLVYRIKGEDSSRAIWIMAHTDVVPEGDRNKWESDPFELKVDGDKLIGRGVEDNHQGLVAAYLTGKAFIETGLKPKYDLCLLFVADEEVGSKYGIGYLLEHHDIFGKDDIILVPDSGDESGANVEVAEKSIVWLKISTKGKQCHGSRPDQGRNAFRAASNLVVKLEDLYKEFDVRDELFQPPISTFEPTKKEANVPNVNTIPGDDVFYVDCRVLPTYKLQDVENRIRQWADEIEKKFDVKMTIGHLQRAEAARPTSVDAPVVVALMAGIKEVSKVNPKPMGIGGGTVAALFRNRGYGAAVWAKIFESAHQPNEFALISNIIGDAKVFVHVCVNA